jgi:hypothetical protein
MVFCFLWLVLLALKCVLVDLAVLHDQVDVLFVVAEDQDVLQRIALDQQDVGIGEVDPKNQTVL